tara:strand:- start:283 stop:495 length:213 start_codon:yes stop_codon:yes gene_type:complete
MKYCTKCLYPSTKPDLWFKDDICRACHAYENRKNYDWTNGAKVFADLLKRSKTNPKYDCIVPVSGGKDST